MFFRPISQADMPWALPCFLDFEADDVNIHNRCLISLEPMCPLMEELLFEGDPESSTRSRPPNSLFLPPYDVGGVFQEGGASSSTSRTR